jgi:hypothetical protein
VLTGLGPNVKFASAYFQTRIEEWISYI